MKDIVDMTPEELREWEASEIEKSRRAFAGEPLPEISRVKAADYPHLRQVGWGFSLVAGSPVRIWRDAGGDFDDGVVVGLRAITDGGPLALLVRAGDGTVWALRRHDGVAHWAERTTTRWTSSEELRLRVTAWPVEDVAQEEVPAPEREQEWLVQSDQLVDEKT